MMKLRHKICIALALFSLVAIPIAMALDVNGELKGALAELLSDEPTGGGSVEGRFYYDTTDNQLKYKDDSAWRAVVTEDGTETLTNKSLTGVLIDDFVEFSEETAPTTPDAGKVRVYAKDDGKLYKKSGDGLEQAIGSGSGGGGEVNYVTSPDSATGWVSTGTGITATTTVDADELPRAGYDTQALLLTNAGSGTAGVTHCFQVGVADQAKILKLEATSKPDGTNYATGDFTMALVQHDNADCSDGGTAVRLHKADSTSPVDVKNGYIQQEAFVAYDDYYSLTFERAAGASGWIALSSITVGPGRTLDGATVTPWESFTPTVANVATSSTWGEWRQVGDTMEYRGHAVYSAAPTGIVSFSLPDSYTTDLEENFYLGSAGFYDASENIGFPGSPYMVSSTTIGFYSEQVTGAWDTNSPVASPASGDRVSFLVNIPIVEWRGKGTTQMLTQGHLYANAKVGYIAASNATVGTSDPVPFNTEITSSFPKIGKWSNTAGSITNDSADGYYSIQTRVGIDGTLSASRAISINVNGSNVMTIGRNESGATEIKGGANVYLQKGDVVQIRPVLGSIDVQSLGSATWIQISRISDYSHGDGVGLGLATDTLPGLVLKNKWQKKSETSAITSTGEHAALEFTLVPGRTYQVISRIRGKSTTSGSGIKPLNVNVRDGSSGNSVVQHWINVDGSTLNARSNDTGAGIVTMINSKLVFDVITITSGTQIDLADVTVIDITDTAHETSEW